MRIADKDNTGVKLSIIVPVYKAEKYLPKCISSILEQSFKNFELLLIDDGSPDKCPAICDEYAKLDSRVKVIHQQNAGVSRARNRGLEFANGQWIGFVDSDDFIERTAYEQLIEVAELNDCDAAIMDFAYVDENGLNIPGKERTYGDMMLLDRKDLVGMQFDIPLSIRLVMFNKIVKREILEGLFFDESIKCAEDTLLLSQCIERINEAVFIRQPLYYNVQRQGSAMHGGLKIKDIAMSLDIHKQISLRTKELYPELYDAAFYYYIDSCVWKMRTYGNENPMWSDEIKFEHRKIYNSMRHRLLKELPGIIKCKKMSWKQKIHFAIIGVTG